MLCNNRTVACAVIALVCGTSFGAVAETHDMDRMVVTAPTTDGKPFICTSTTCGDAVQDVQMMMFWEQENAEMSQDEKPIDRQQACKWLKAAQPPGCNLSSPPSVPGYDRGWVGNGCGDGSFASVVAEELVDSIVPGYRGSLDYPLPGVSFHSACQRHDYCYASGRAKPGCDADFRNALGAVCDASNTYQSSCRTLAVTYNWAVKNAGQGAYNASRAELTCASWAYDMKQNGCGK